MTPSFLSIPGSIPQLIYRSCTISLFAYELRWQNYSSFLWLCQCGWSTTYRHTGSLEIRVELCTQMDRGLIILSVFATFVAWQSDFSFKKHSTNLIWQILGQIYIQGFCPEVFFSDSTAMLTVCLTKQVPGEQASSRKLDRTMNHIILHQGWPWHYTWISGQVLNAGRTKRGKNLQCSNP